MRNYDKPLTFILTGSGISKPENSRTLLEDFIFGNLPGDAVVDVKFVVPYFGKISPSLNAAIEILKEWGIDGDDFIPVVEPNSGHKSLVTATKTEQVDKGDSEQHAIDLLSQARSDGRDVFYISIYDPERDISSVTDAKDWTWLPTLNLAEGLIDSFDGYESEEDRLKREELQRKFDEEQKAKEAAEKPVKEPAKKATTPRKRAAKKPVAVEDVPLVDAPEMPLVAPQIDKGWGPHEHKYVWGDDGIGHSGSFCECGKEEPAPKPKPAAGLIADAVAREAEKKAARELLELESEIAQQYPNDTVTLSGTIVVGKSEFHKDLEPVRKDGDSWEEIKDGYVYGYQMINGEIQSTGSMGLHSELSHVPADMAAPDVWKDVAAAVPADTTHITVSIDDMVKLSAGMKKMAEGFTEIISAYSQMLEDK